MVVKGSRDLLFKFWDPFISQKLLKLETSNLVRRLESGGPKRNNTKLGQKGSIRGHVTYFLKCWDSLHIYGTAKARNLKFDMQIDYCGT